MMIKIRNWKLALLSLVLILILISLGFWQLSRAHEKASLLKNFQARGSMPPASAKDLSVLRDWRFYQLKVEGKFDEAHTFLLDNKIFNGKVGYEVYTPFKAKGVDVAILVDRGLIAADWAKRFPNNSAPFYSTIVYLTRKGNPKNIHNWDDLAKPNVKVIIPNPKTSGNGRYSYLVAWGSVIVRGGTEAQARDLVSRMIKNVPIFSTARWK